MTQSEFYSQICDLPDRFPPVELETYLSALLKLVEQEKHQEMNADLLLHLLEQAFQTEPAAFDPAWLQLTTAPDTNVLSRKFTNPDVSEGIDKSVQSELEGVEFTLAVLRFQIAELHKMRGKQLEDKMRYFGVTSESGNLWYNFDPFTNLESGVSCMLDNEDETEEEVTFSPSWQFIGELLEMGRIYE